MNPEMTRFRDIEELNGVRDKTRPARKTLLTTSFLFTLLVSSSSFIFSDTASSFTLSTSSETLAGVNAVQIECVFVVGDTCGRL